MEDYNLGTIFDMIDRFGFVTGLSAHAQDNTTAIASVALGASIIEKHFTLDRNGGGSDDSFSLEPHQMAALCRDTKIAWKALGNIDYGRKSSEKEVGFVDSMFKESDVKAPDVMLSIILLIGLFGWIGSMIAFIFSGFQFRQERRLLNFSSFKWILFSFFFFGIWIVGMVNA